MVVLAASDGYMVMNVGGTGFILDELSFERGDVQWEASGVV